MRPFDPRRRLFHFLVSSVIDDVTLQRIVQNGLFRFDINLMENPWVGSDIIWGTGLKDIDHVTDLMLNAMASPQWQAKYPNDVTFKLDTAIDGTDTQLTQVTLDDLVRLRAIFIDTWGEVNKVTSWLRNQD